MLRVLPQHSTFSAGFSPIKNRYLIYQQLQSDQAPAITIKKKLLREWWWGEVPTSLGLCLLGSLSQ